MAKGKVRLAGRFPAGTQVALVRVADASVLRSEGGEELSTKEVSKDGTVEFPMDVGARGFIVGYVDGALVEARVTGREADDIAATVSQPPVGPDRVRLSDGSWADEAPERVKKSDLPLEAAPFLSQQQVPAGMEQRSDTLRGTAHPMHADEPAPYESQENVDDDVRQMSDTETGAAARVAVGPQRQEDVPTGVWQRSDTPTGVATPVPGGGAVEAQRTRESSLAKEMRGEPGRAAAEPLRTATGAGGGEVSNEPAGVSQPGEGDRTGTDAMGQPAYPDLAAAAQVGEAKKPTAARRGDAPDAKVPKTPQTSGAEAKREAVPEPSQTRRARPPKGDMAADQAADEAAKVEPVKAPGRPQKS